MSEKETELQVIINELQIVKKELHSLKKMLRPESATWLTEDEAADKLGCEPKTLRCNAVYRPTEKHPKWGKWLDIDFRKNPEGYGYQYSRKSIESFMLKTSTAA